MKIFITGGNGFIGSHLVPKLLARKHRLLLLTREKGTVKNRKLNLVAGNLAGISKWSGTVRRFNPEAIIHLAWEGIPDFSPAISRKNLCYSIELLKLARDLKVKKFIGVGSAWEYGDSLGKAKESNRCLLPHKPVRAFVDAKKAIQKFGEEVAKKSGMQFLWAILFFVYGPGQKSASLIPYLVSEFKNHKTPDIRNRKSGNDFIYVGDVADALVAILEKSKKRSAAYNIGSGRIMGVARVANLVAKNFGKSAIAKEPKRPKGFWADISKIKRDVGWRPKTGIVLGIKKTVDFLKSLRKKPARLTQSYHFDTIRGAN